MTKSRNSHNGTNQEIVSPILPNLDINYNIPTYPSEKINCASYLLEKLDDIIIPLSRPFAIFMSRLLA
jgi:hypothetical protein